MTREEFIKKYKNDCSYYFDGYYSDCIDDFLTNIYDEHEAQLKVKENHIVELNKMVKAKDEQIEILQISSHGFECLYDDYKMLSHKIVAMLFWDMKKYDRYSKVINVQDYVNNKNKFFALELVFKKAYAMLKDKQ